MLLPPAVAQKLRLRFVQLRAVSRCCIVSACQRFTMLRLLWFMCCDCARLSATNKACNSEETSIRKKKKLTFEKLWFCCKLSRDHLTGLCFLLFAIIQVSVSKWLVSTKTTHNRPFQKKIVSQTLRILRPKNWEAMLTDESLSGWSKSRENWTLKWKNHNVSWQRVQTENYVLRSQINCFNSNFKTTWRQLSRKAIDPH